MVQDPFTLDGAGDMLVGVCHCAFAITSVPCHNEHSVLVMSLGLSESLM